MTDPTVDREARHAELAQRFLPDDLLETLRERAAEHDAENSFAHDDLADLQERGYLTLFVPEEMGGAGLNLHEVTRLQQRLAGAAPGTALAINMHLMTTGVVHAMRARGDHSLDWVLEEAAAGEVFAFGISEPANDWVLQGSNTKAVPQDDGGYLLSGVKIFTSLSPVWSRLIVHGLDESNPEDPRLVYGFVERTADGITVSDDWDVLGMRASHSRATILEDVRMEPHRVARNIEPGPVPDLLTFAITSNFQLLVASVYAGVAQRALVAGADALHQRRSAKKGVSMAEVPESRVRLADAHLDLVPVLGHLDSCARDFDEVVDHGAGWPHRLVAARIHAARAARACAEAALLSSGGRGFGNDHEISRLLRDATAGLFHPPSEDAARPMYAAALLDG
ncbi:MAG TPA: acyl-CoA/acyl-ACP dehydrogenase [Brevibacterium senegalense]|uniref:Acyl-CoA/acyl-ACP dehydrogenase n=1 Tax=Brevibacterium senegalense TaxID=1033736 RepID=A0A921MCT1_9MICO|nr:acyl-CoA/acyl-ACP dehydrogenase [Brevibacterium senegalense]